jgi:hypothetical protein
VLASQNGAVPPGIDPYAPLSSVVTRIPDQNIVELPRDAAIHAVLSAMQSSPVGIVVLTEHGRPYGIASPRLVNEAAARN